MKSNAKLGLQELDKDHLNYFKQFYDVNLIPEMTSPFHQIHHAKAIEKALEILTWMFKNEIALIFIEPDPAFHWDELEPPIKHDVVKQCPFAFDLPEGALLIQNYAIHLDVFKALSKSNAVFILEPARTLHLSFNEIVKELIPPYKEDVYYLSKIFLIPYEDWFLATILYQLEETQKDWMLKHLDTPFVSSISADTRLYLKPISASIFMFVEDFSEAIKKYFEQNLIEKIKDQSFGFNFHFKYKE